MNKRWQFLEHIDRNSKIKWVIKCILYQTIIYIRRIHLCQGAPINHNIMKQRFKLLIVLLDALFVVRIMNALGWCLTFLYVWHTTTITTKTTISRIIPWRSCLDECIIVRINSLKKLGSCTTLYIEMYWRRNFKQWSGGDKTLQIIQAVAPAYFLS